ncbi:MAG: FeoC-like transcriptional regulator [Actinomycetia bacterium]|nr:FeoC-like transcriptional regulator [Actinomycetes bacterium]
MSGAATAAGPLSLVLDAIQGGARTPPAIGVRTGLSLDVVRAVLEHLVRTGRLSTDSVSAACPGGSCRACALAGDCGAALVGGGALVRLRLARD